MPERPAKFPSTDTLQQPGYTAWEPMSPTRASLLTSSLTSTNFKPIAARLARRRRRSSRYRQTVFSHDSREKVVDLDGSCVDHFGSKLGSSTYFGNSSLFSTSIYMVRSHVSEPVASTSKHGSEGDCDGDDRKRRPPPRKPPPEEASFRPRRCRKCKAEGKKGRKYCSAKGLPEQCVCHHGCSYRAVTDRYISLSTEDCRRQVASIQAGRRHRPVSDTYFAVFATTRPWSRRTTYRSHADNHVDYWYHYLYFISQASGSGRQSSRRPAPE